MTPAEKAEMVKELAELLEAKKVGMNDAADILAMTARAFLDDKTYTVIIEWKNLC